MEIVDGHDWNIVSSTVMAAVNLFSSTLLNYVKIQLIIKQFLLNKRLYMLNMQKGNAKKIENATYHNRFNIGFW